MLDVGHWQPFQGGKLPYVEGLPGLPPEGITDLHDREHHQVTVRPVAGEPHVAADRHLGVGLAGVGGGGQVPGHPVGEGGGGAVPALADVGGVQVAARARVLPWRAVLASETRARASSVATWRRAVVASLVMAVTASRPPVVKAAGGVKRALQVGGTTPYWPHSTRNFTLACCLR